MTCADSRPHGVEDAGGVVGHHVEVVATLGLVRPPDAAVVEADGAPARSEREALQQSGGAVGAETLDEEDGRRAGPPQHVEGELRAVARGRAAHERWSMLSWISARTASIVSATASGPGPVAVRGDTGAPDLHPPSAAQLATGHRHRKHGDSELDGGRHRLTCELTDPRSHPILTVEEDERELPGAEHAGELVGTILHSAHPSQHRADRRDVRHAEHAKDAAGRLPDRARNRERLGHPDTAIRDQHGRTFGRDVLGALHADHPPRRQQRAQHGHEVGIETPLVDDVRAVDAPPDDVGEGAHARVLMRPAPRAGASPSPTRRGP